MKIKTKKSALKRIKIKKNSLIRKKAYKSHLLGHKSSKRLRSLGSPTKIHKNDILSFKKMLPYAKI